MKGEFGAKGIGAGQFQPAAVAADQFGGDGQAQPGAALARPALKRLEQMFARARRQAGAGVADPYPPFLRRLAGRDLDAARCGTGAAGRL